VEHKAQNLGTAAQKSAAGVFETASDTHQLLEQTRDETLFFVYVANSMPSALFGHINLC
jgi:hypothetical protein